MDKLQPLITESAQLMLIGMGTVFIILILLIFLITLVSKVITSLKLQDEPEITRSAHSVSKQTQANPDNELIAVISCAISSYKKRHSIT